MNLPALLAAALLAASSLAFAQAQPQGDPPRPKAERRAIDCSKAKDPKLCEERVAKMRAARDQARSACQGKQGAEHRECMRHEMCAQTKDAKACEERTARVKSAASKAREACQGKQGTERRDCMRHEMCSQAQDPAKCEAQWKERAERRSAPK